MATKQSLLGEPLAYVAIPEKHHIALAGLPQSGKSSFLTKFSKRGTVLVIDSDGRLGDVIPEDTTGYEFYPISREKSDMNDVDKIVSKLKQLLPVVGKETSMLAVDTVNRILDKIVLDIQTSKKFTTVYDYKPKAEAMKKLRSAFDEWNCETAWLYHVKEFLEKDGGDYVTKEKSAISDLEYVRMSGDITIKLEIVVDKNGKRGVKVLKARRGRSGMVVWDESGNWENIRENLETAIWGGLTREDQDELEQVENVNFSTVADVLAWAVETGAYNVVDGRKIKDDARANVAQASYEKLKKELQAEMGNDLTAEVMFEAFKQKVLGKLEEK